MGSGVIKHKVRECGENRHGVAVITGGSRDPRQVKEKKERGGAKEEGQRKKVVKTK